VQPFLAGIDLYPLKKYDGKMKQRDWSKLPKLESPTGGSGATETRWVFPERFLDQLPLVLDDAPPLRGEEARYAQMRAMIAIAGKDSALNKAMVDEFKKTDAEVVAPLLQFRAWGIPLPHHWSTQNNGAAFGTDYFTRTAVAKSNILVNKPNETKYYYQDLDENGARLESRHAYTVTFAKGKLPPVNGFWSLSLYNSEHFFEDNAIHRFSVGTKNKDLKTAADGSLTIYVQPDPPADPVQRANWLPAPRGSDLTLFIRAYWPQPAITSGAWTPPPVVKTR